MSSPDVIDLVRQAMQLPETARQPFLKRALAGDSALLAEARELLALTDDDDDFLEPPTSSSASPSSARQGIPGFELLREIGRGAMGVVHLALEKDLDRQVAMKILHPVAALDARSRRRFEREAMKSARLDHEHIVKIHRVGATDGIPWFTMEHLSGGDLHTAILNSKAGREGQLPARGQSGYWPRVAAVVREAALGLAEAHREGLIHRDIKPQNLLFTHSGLLKLIDFGIARDENMGNETRTAGMLGTISHMSPEQASIKSQCRIDHRTDIYSLGVVLYELISGRPPYDAQGDDLLQQVRQDAPPSLRRLAPGAPGELVSICEKAMERAPDDRYQQAIEIADELLRFLDRVPILTGKRPILRRIKQGACRHRARIGVATLLVIALAVGRLISVDEPQALLSVHAQWFRSEQPIVDGEVWLRPIDTLRGVPLERVRLGELPVSGARVDPGFYRVVVQREGGDFRELIRYFDAKRTYEISVGFRRDLEDPTKGMVRIEGARGYRARPDSPKGSKTCHIEEHAVDIAPFLIDAHEVTNRAYREFIRATGRSEPELWCGRYSKEWDELPVAGLTWAEMVAYAEWAGKRLPTHPEWEFAARGPDGRFFPWGDEPPYRGNTRGVRITSPKTWEERLALYLANVKPVGSHPEAATRGGAKLYNMLGNVREFTESPLVILEGDEPRTSVLYRITMGQAWDAEARERTLATHGHLPNAGGAAYSFLGFRCARTIDP